MFDGDFRTRRREVNLSGSHRRGRNKKDLLRNAEALRKQRQEKVRNNKAARLIQRTVRGWLSKLETLEWCCDQSPMKIEALSMCLSHSALLSKFHTSPRELLLRFEKEAFSPQPMNVCNEDDHWSTTSPNSRKRILRYALQEFRYTDPDTNRTNDRIYRLLIANRESTMDDAIFLELAKCLQAWCMLRNSQDPYQKMLTEWAVDASAQLANPHAKALLATILLSAQKVTQQGYVEEWLEILANIVPSGQNTGDSRDVLWQATMDNLRSSKVQRLLSSLLDLTRSPRLVLFIRHVLCQPQNKKLKLAVSLLARGDSLEKFQHDSFGQNKLRKSDWDDDDDDDGDSDIDDNDPSRKPSSHKKAKAWSSHYKRQDILTMTKLDKLYSDRVQQTMKDLDPCTIDVANKVTRAPWKEWGLMILDDEGECNLKNSYLETLGYLLEASSSLRPKIRFTPLSSLAFNETILRSLWNLLREKSSQGVLLSVFSDLFSHYLVALSDEDFVKYHCENNENDQRKILAKDIVQYYGKQLHELYWTKPVVSTEIQVDNHRGRLLLSGTKLWNALYERWNRLVNLSFCEESAWWFPQMGFNEGDKAVLSNSEVGQHVDHDSDDENDNDDFMDVEDARNELSTAEAATDALADSFRDPKMARLLTSIPQALPFDRRLKLFHSLLRADKRNVMQAAQSRRAMMAQRGRMWDENDTTMMWIDGSVREQIVIKRASLYDDSMEQLNALGSKLKHKVQVTFINKHGAEEPGIDGGGVFKEFLDDLIKDGFAAKSDEKQRGDAPQLFSITPKQQLSVNLDLSEEKNMLVDYEFLGRVLGKAVYESILVEPQFCLPFLNQLLGKVNTLEDLKNYDEEYYNNLNKLRHFSEEEIDSMGLSFELTVGGTSQSFAPRTVDLVRNGRSISVSKKNVFQYTQAVANELLNILGADQTRAFLKGFRDLIKVAWIRLFSAKELQKLISGDDSVRGIDVPSLKKAVQYLGGYHESQPYIQDFWDILENELSPEQQRKFLRFMTSCSRQPLLGFSSLEPFPAIQQIRLQDNERTKNSRLPTSSTCMNLLKLPNYQDRALLKEKLLAAVESGAGFELT